LYTSFTNTKNRDTDVAAMAYANSVGDLLEHVQSRV